MKSLNWNKECLTLLNQTRLPMSVEFIECKDWRVVAEAIRRLEVRGAPAIGAAAAFGLVLGACELKDQKGDFWQKLLLVAEELRQTRPTAVNLFWAIDRMMSVASRFSADNSLSEVIEALEKEALAIANEDREVNKKISQYGATLFNQPGMSVLTHCNAGALATVDFGTALGVIRQAWSEKRIKRVFADETRPLLQGARLTAWELMQENIPVTLITDNMAGWVMKQNMVQAVIVGADRITLNGDVANKIGTYSVAVLAREHNIPFYVAAPVSTFDFAMDTGDDIPIEERNSQEITTFGGVSCAPEGVDVFNPAFDVTPNHLVSAIITEFGILKAPYHQAISQLKQQKGGK
jgi:methylthioribose-1-phosphate isomerase